MRPLVEQGYLYRAVTPLYIIRNKKEELYFYTEEEYSKWKQTHPTPDQVIRAKGIGELNPLDLRTVCFEQERFKRITVSDAKATTELLQTLMGKDVQPRKQYIYDNASQLGFNFM